MFGLLSSFLEAPHIHLHKILIELYMYDFDSVFFINANYFAKYISLVGYLLLRKLLHWLYAFKALIFLFEHLSFKLPVLSPRVTL